MKKLESFFWGIIAALGATVFQFIFFLATTSFIAPKSQLSFDQFYVVPGVVLLFAFLEEFFKYLMLTKRIIKSSAGRDFLLNACLVGLGFFTLELGLILSSGGNLEIQKILAIAILHIGTTILMSSFMLTTKKSSLLYLVAYPLLLATGLHASFNWLILQASPISNAIAILILSLLIFLAFKLFTTSNKLLAQD